VVATVWDNATRPVVVHVGNLEAVYFSVRLSLLGLSPRLEDQVSLLLIRLSYFAGISPRYT
jgi:hypothetical protein